MVSMYTRAIADGDKGGLVRIYFVPWAVPDVIRYASFKDASDFVDHLDKHSMNQLAYIPDLRSYGTI